MRCCIRFMVLAGACLGIAGCSLGPASLSLGYNGSAARAPSPKVGGSLAGKPAPVARSSPDNRVRMSALDPRTNARASGRVPDTRLMAANARKLINEYRKSHGLRPLELNALLTKAAKAHSEDLSKWDRISHYGSDGSNPWERVRRTGYKPRVAAENVGTGQATLAEVFAGWKKSPGHNKNLLMRDATQMGIALVHDPRTEFKTFWTLVLGRPT